MKAPVSVGNLANLPDVCTIFHHVDQAPKKYWGEQSLTLCYWKPTQRDANVKIANVESHAADLGAEQNSGAPLHFSSSHI